MTERDEARAAQTKVGRGDWIPRLTKAEVLAVGVIVEGLATDPKEVGR